MNYFQANTNPLAGFTDPVYIATQLSRKGIPIDGEVAARLTAYQDALGRLAYAALERCGHDVAAVADGMSVPEARQIAVSAMRYLESTIAAAPGYGLTE